MNGFLMSMMNDRYCDPKIKVIFENYTVTHTDGVTYTRVRSRDRLVWIPISYLPKDPVYDEMYEIPERVFELYRMMRH